MNTAKKLINNTGYSFLSQFIRLAFNAFIFIYLARVLQIEDFGKFTFAITFTTLFLYVVDFGFDRLVVREVSRDNTLIDKIVSNLMVVKAALAITTALIMFIIINLMGSAPETKKLVYLLTGSIVFFSYTLFLNAIFRGLEKLKYETIVVLINNVLLIILVFVFLKNENQVLGIGYAFLVARIAGFICGLMLLLVHLKKISYEFNYQFCLKIFKQTLPFAMLAGAMSVLFDIDTVILSYFKGDTEVGLYQSAMKIISTIAVIPLILEGSFFPLLSRVYKQENQFNDISKQLMTTLLYLGIPMTIGILALADKIIMLVYGPNFTEATRVLQILSLVLLLRFILRGYEILLLALGKQKTILYVIVCAALFNVAFNIYCIPKYGMLGAALAAALSHFLVLTAYMLITKQNKQMVYFEKSLLVILISGLLPGILIYSFRSYHLGFLIIGYGIFYFASTFYFLKSERSVLFENVRSSWLIEKSIKPLNE